MKVIAVSGWKSSGKDTVAEYLVKEHGFQQYSFAKTLKDMVATTYNIPREWCDSTEMKEKPLLQYKVKTTDNFCYTIHELLKDEFRDYKIDNGEEVDFVKCFTPRALLIMEGSAKRAADPNFWVNKVINNIKQEELLGGLYSNDNFVISDWRYISEYAGLKKEFKDDIKFVRINRFTEATSRDPSETQLNNFNKFDFVINNTGTKEELFQQVDKLIKEI